MTVSINDHTIYYLRQSILRPKFYNPSSGNDTRPVLMNAMFSASHNPLRAEALEGFEGLYTKPSKMLNFDEYLNILSRSKFTLSPPGINN